MAWGSVAVGALSFIMMVAGFFLSWVPVLGSLLSFGAPVVSLAGIVMGGVAMSRAKQSGEESGAAIGGLIVSIIAFFPALLVALTCGMCNACLTAGTMDPSLHRGRSPFGAGGNPFLVPRTAHDGGQPSLDMGTLPKDAGPVGYPPPAFPPPPVPGSQDPGAQQPGAQGAGVQAAPGPAPDVPSPPGSPGSAPATGPAPPR